MIYLRTPRLLGVGVSAEFKYSVQKIDEDALISIIDASEVDGRGFNDISEGKYPTSINGSDIT